MIVELPFSGNHAKIYTLENIENQKTLFDNFLQRFVKSHPHEIRSIVETITHMGNKKGVAQHLIKDHEGSPGDGIVALFDQPDYNLRLYCIKFGNGILILGDGGEKSKSIRAWQEDKILTEKNKELQKISKIITQKIIDKEITISEDGIEFSDDLII